MRLPEFVAEASLYRPSEKYTGFFARASQGVSTVVAQFDYSTLGPDYWANVANQYFFCQRPCGRDKHGNCHCPTVGAPVGGPNLPTGIAT
jgi:hypothetical protein